MQCCKSQNALADILPGPLRLYENYYILWLHTTERKHKTLSDFETLAPSVFEFDTTRLKHLVEHHCGPTGRVGCVPSRAYVCTSGHMTPSILSHTAQSHSHTHTSPPPYPTPLLLAPSHPAGGSGEAARAAAHTR